MPQQRDAYAVGVWGSIGEGLRRGWVKHREGYHACHNVCILLCKCMQIHEVVLWARTCPWGFVDLEFPNIISIFQRKCKLKTSIPPWVYFKLKCVSIVWSLRKFIVVPRHIHQAEHCSVGWFQNATPLWQVGIETAEGEGEEEGYGDEF